MTNNTIYSCGPQTYPELINIWEAAVRTTHTFLKEEDILFLKPLILSRYFDAVSLFGIREEDRTCGFIGISNEKVEMLFIHPDYRGKGLGKHLLQFAIREHHVSYVDVNEQNTQAIGFYLHSGFRIIARDPLDGFGKPYPILHLQLPI